MLHSHSNHPHNAEGAVQHRCPLLLDAIVKVQSMVIEQRPASSIFEELLEVLLKVTDSKFGFIGEILTDEDSARYLKSHAITNIAWNDETREFLAREQANGLIFRNLQTLFGRVITTGEPLITNSPRTHEASGGTPDGHPELNAFMGLPFYQSEEFMGMVGVANAPEGYTQETATYLSPLLNACGYVIGARRLEQHRQQSEARLQTLSAIVQSSSDAIISTDRKGTIVSWNAGATKLLGFTEADALGNDLTIIVPLQEREAHFELVERVLQGETLETIETVRLSQTNQQIDVSLTFSPTFDHAGHVSGTSAILRNITKRKKSQEKLIQADAFKAAVLQAASEVSLVVADTYGTITLFNRGAEKLFGYLAEDVVRQKSMLALHQEQGLQTRSVELSEQFHHTIEGIDVLTLVPSMSKLETREWQLVKEDGSTFPAEVTISAVMDRKNTIQGYLAVAIDLTKVKKSERQLRSYNSELEQANLANEESTQRLKLMVAELEAARQKAERAAATKGNFLANMSHEIRTPINGIMGMTDLALGLATDSEQQEYLKTVNQCSDHLLSLVNDILDISKIEAGRMELAPVDFSPAGLLRDVARTVTPDAQKKGLPLSYVVQEEVPGIVVGDLHRLRQILLNLVSNAIKFTHRGEVRVEINIHSKTDSHCRLTYRVVDDGIGIPADQQSAIFQSFSQADSSTTRNFGGTGLGLAISSELVSLMSGELTVESELGQGSTFSFSITHPISQKQASDSGSDNSNPDVGPSPKVEELQLLLAEDNPINRRLATAMLEKQGHHVSVAHNGRDALECLKTQQFDLVLMDVQMPVLDGLETIQRIREQEAETGEHLPIISVTAHALPEDRDRCLAAGADDYLSKPFKPKELSETIERTLEYCRRINSATSSLESDETGKTMFDLDRMLDTIGGDESILYDILNLYLDQRPKLLQALDAGLQSEDPAAIFQAAHTIKGSVGLLCAQQAYATAFELEQRGREENLAECGRLIPELKRELQNLELRFAEVLPQS